MGPATPQMPVVAFDLGGTWFRSAVISPNGDAQDLRTHPAIGRSRFPHAPAAALQQGLADYVLSEVRQRRAELVGEDGALAVGISLGAAINARTEIVIGSAPLWGPDAPVFDLGGLLRSAEPGVHWTIVNDVSAAAIAFAATVEELGVGRIAALAVGTGIAMRTIDVASRHIATDPLHGLQGEVGHLPAGPLEVDGRAFDLHCDCGALNHVSSFVSGRGLERVLAAHAGGMTVEEFAVRVRAGDAGAVQLLDAATRPLSRTLLDQAVLDPACELVALCGGVVDGLGDAFLHSLLRNLNELGMYGVSDHDEGYFRRRLVLTPPGSQLNLRGAGQAASQGRQPAPRNPTGVDRDHRGWTVRAQKPVAYPVQVVPDLLDPRNGALAQAARNGSTNGGRRVVVIDARVDELWGERIRAYFAAHEVPIEATPMSCPEEAKTMERVFELVQAMDRAAIARRSEPLIVFGGGILMDVVGLATSIYRRGVPYVRVPTTLIGQIDAGVGVKTAVNFAGAKSRLGTYHAPSVALLDPAFLRTLDRREISNGLAEIVKIALVKDARLFYEVERNAELLLDTAFACAPGHSVAAGAIEAMLGELAPNLWEAELERLADFGHTFSPAFEMAEQPPLLHGEAVAIDMALSCMLSVGRGWLSDEELGRILNLLRRCELPVHCETCRPEVVWAALTETALHRDGLQRLPLLTGIGEAVFVNDVSAAELDVAVQALERAVDPATPRLARTL
jgi:3-dehydroquinate synthetase/predicted NBD/HSP70 family sugar kinase